MHDLLALISVVACALDCFCRLHIAFCWLRVYYGRQSLSFSVFPFIFQTWLQHFKEMMRCFNHTELASSDRWKSAGSLKYKYTIPQRVRGKKKKFRTPVWSKLYHLWESCQVTHCKPNSQLCPGGFRQTALLDVWKRKKGTHKHRYTTYVTVTLYWRVQSLKHTEFWSFHCFTFMPLYYFHTSIGSINIMPPLWVVLDRI